MPGLGDALSKAFEDSMHDLDALVDKAAQGEEDTAESGAVEAPPPDPGDAAEEKEQPAAAPEAEPEAAGVSRSEKTSLLDPQDLPDGGESLAGPPPPPPPEDAEEPAPAPAEESQPETSPGPVEEPSSPPPSAEEEERPPPVEEPSAAEVTSPTMSEPVAPFAQFAPSGVIRRRLRKKKPAAGPAPAGPGAEPFLAGAPPAPRPAPQDVESFAPSGEVVLTVCRRVAALENVFDYSIPLLVDGVGGVVRLVTSGAAGDPAVLAVCGAGSRAGTTTVAAAAALKLAEQEERRVLLVDADFRTPGLRRLVGESVSGPDFKAVLNGEASLSDAVLYSRKENLAVLPLYGRPERSGSALARTADGLASGVMVNFLAACREQFDAVVLDAGSLAAWAGPGLVARAAGRAVLVVRSGRINGRSAAGLKARLERAGTRLVGALLTFA